MREDIVGAAAGCGDPELVDRIMGLIRSYCKKNEVIPCPIELRDTLLAVAALAHLEAARMECRAMQNPADDFALAAHEIYQEAKGMLAAPVFCAHAPVRISH